MTIGDKIRIRRRELGLSVDDLAARLGKNRATVYRYENGDIENLPLGILAPLASALETTEGYLIGNYEKITKAVPQQENGEIAEITKLFSGLSDEKKQTVLEFLRFLAKSEDK